MTEVGEKGRLPSGESWARAMALVEAAIKQGSKRRYRVVARLVEPGWWAYSMSSMRPDRPDPVRVQASRDPMTTDRVAELAAQLPRCAQRAKAAHGGETKVAWPNGALAWQAANALGHSAYRCKLPAPALGEHWHTTSKKPQRRYRG